MMALLWQSISKAATTLLSCTTVVAQMQATALSMGVPGSPVCLHRVLHECSARQSVDSKEKPRSSSQRLRTGQFPCSSELKQGRMNGR